MLDDVFQRYDLLYWFSRFVLVHEPDFVFMDEVWVHEEVVEIPVAGDRVDWYPGVRSLPVCVLGCVHVQILLFVSGFCLPLSYVFADFFEATPCKGHDFFSRGLVLVLEVVEYVVDDLSEGVASFVVWEFCVHCTGFYFSVLLVETHCITSA